MGLPSRDGKEEARVAVLPFVPERKVVDACAVMGPEHEWYEEYARRIEQILQPPDRGLHAADGQPGARPRPRRRAPASAPASGRSTSARSTASTPQQLPANAQYIGPRPPAPAAGAHGARRSTLYSGSLLELDFGEKEQEKRVVIVDGAAGRRGEASSRCRSPPAAACATCRARSTSWPDLAATLGDDYLRVRVKVDGSGAGPRRAGQGAAAERARRAPRLPARARTRVPPTLTGGARAPAELFADFYRRKHQAPPPERSCCSSSTRSTTRRPQP